MLARHHLLLIVAVVVALLYLLENRIALGAHAQAAVSHAIGELFDGALSVSRATR